jgi:predicted SAM-dependent methyltransferase
MLSAILKRYRKPLKKLYIRYRKPLQAVYIPLHKIGNSRKCYVCGNTFGHFIKYKGGSAFFPEWISKLEMVGSDVDNFGCPYCGSFDRERHLFMYFDKLHLWEKMKGSGILHFAPEYHLSRKIEDQKPGTYVKGDLFPKDATIVKVDATAISYQDNTFDLVIANHILEHIPDYQKALREIYRVMKPGGTAILQTPFSKVLTSNFEDAAITTPSLRAYFYAQHDHVRVFGERALLNALQQAGFTLELARHADWFTEKETYLYGVNKMEDLIRVRKPKD